MNTTSVDLTVNALSEAADALGTLDLERLTRCYRPDVVLDANVPHWRYQLQGAGAVGTGWVEELAQVPGAQVVEHRVTEMTGGVVVEIEARFDGTDGQSLWREVHLLRGDRGGIGEHTVYCTGIWTPEQRARQAAEAPMVRPWP